MHAAFSASLDAACCLAGGGFDQAVTRLRPVLQGMPAVARQVGLAAWVEARLDAGDTQAVASLLYLVAHAHAPDTAVACGRMAIERGCDDDAVLVALADVLHLLPGRVQEACALLERHAGTERSTAFIRKLADFQRDDGCAFLAEATLSSAVRRGHAELALRLAEHFVEFNDWRSARETLEGMPPSRRDSYATWLLGRSCVSLLLEDEVIRAADALWTAPQPGPLYAQLLHDVWRWRVGEVEQARPWPPAGMFPPLLERDAARMREVGSPEPPGPGVSKVGWRSLRPYARVPAVLGIGAQRTATTWLWTQLARRPDVQPLPFKEPCFFGDVFPSFDAMPPALRAAEPDAATRHYWEGPTRNLYRYLGLYTQGAQMHIDISPAYFELPDEAVAVVRDLLGPDLKVLLIVRDPVERAWSNLKFDCELAGRSVGELSFGQRVAHYRSAGPTRRSEYVQVLRRWRRHFTAVRTLFFDDIVTRPDEVVAEVEAFLGLVGTSEAASRPPVNSTAPYEIPIADRAFLVGLHRHAYEQAELELGGPARGWLPRQFRLLEA